MSKKKNRNNEFDFDAFDPRWDEYTERFIQMDAEGEILQKELSNAIEKIKIYGTAKDVPDDKRYLVEDFKKKSDNLAKHIIKTEALIKEFEEFEDYMRGGKPEINILS